MRYHYCPNDAEYFATNLRREQGTRNLKWDNARGRDVLIVQTPFECQTEQLMEELCMEMQYVQAQPNEFTEIRPGVWFRFVSSSDKVRMGGCPINTEASTYTVFGCRWEGDECFIYAPKNQAMISAFCNIPMDIHVETIELKSREGLLKKRLVSTGYYAMTFPSGCAGSYRDGDMAYRVGDMLIPITKEMLARETVYIKTATRPEVVSLNSGLQIV